MTYEELSRELCLVISQMTLEGKIEALNTVRAQLHAVSPFKDEPIDYVQWVSTESVHANDYNPNSVAPPEMVLLEHSIDHDGFTQPVVGWPDTENTFEVVDGFHRTTVAKRSVSVRERLSGYMPIVAIQSKNTDRNDRVASTIRHNRARGKHNVESMSDIVIELKKRNWSDQRIAKELGMDADEVLRLCQVSGLAEVFSDESFSMAWESAIHSEEEIDLVSEDDL
jgi:ParB-like chromosome segregation protein Spo0J